MLRPKMVILRIRYTSKFSCVCDALRSMSDRVVTFCNFGSDGIETERRFFGLQRHRWWLALHLGNSKWHRRRRSIRVVLGKAMVC